MHEWRNIHEFFHRYYYYKYDDLYVKAILKAGSMWVNKALLCNAQVRYRNMRTEG